MAKATAWPASSGMTGAVVLFARDDKSGTFDTFKNLVLGDHGLAPSTTRFADSDALAAAVAADPRAIGFVGMSHIGRASPVAISEGGAASIVPSRFSVATEDYPLTRRLYLYVSSPATHPLAAQLATFAQSQEGADPRRRFRLRRPGRYDEGQRDGCSILHSAVRHLDARGEAPLAKLPLSRRPARPSIAEGSATSVDWLRSSDRLATRK